MSTTKTHKEQHVSEVLTKILDDEQKFVSEKRSDFRELLFMPAQVSQAEFESTAHGFTRDVSILGICLIMPQPFHQGTKAEINLFGQSSQMSSLAKCCWSSKFGDAYWVSGWRLNEAVPVGRFLEEDRSVELELRSSDRLTAAVPVGIHMPGNTRRIPGFMRNLSQSGLCLISKVETQPNQVADLEIMRLNGESGRIESRCTWVKQYGEDYWASGWHFNL